jgi:hypothetical protein
MGELGVGVTDLIRCKDCDGNHTMMFQTLKDEWYIVCGNNKCENKTDHHATIFDAACEWGLRSAE